MRSWRVAFVVLVLAAVSVPARVCAGSVMFESGSLIIPMDIDYQNTGMLKAFGLLDKLLRAGIPVAWCINPGKVVVDEAMGKFSDDFTTTATDFKSGAVIASHGYRGGPFVIDAAHAAAASPIITAWQVANTTTVHVATAAFSASVSRQLTAAPRIAVLGDGNQKIAFSYLNAAGIPDESGAVWSDASPGLVTAESVAGPTTTSHADGALFRPSGQPAFCEIMTMHWKVTDPLVPEVSAEMGEFLKFPVHVNAECQAVNAIEGGPPDGGRMKFVAPMGFVWPAPKQPSAVQYSNSALPFAQQDGPFTTIGGSEPAYALPGGTSYYDSGIVMVRAKGEAIGTRDIWMTGYAGGGCSVGEEACDVGNKGKVSYLGGHEYGVKTPISSNPTTQGARLFLNSLYEAGCVTLEGQGRLSLNKSGPALTTTPDISWSIHHSNYGQGPALDVVVTDTLPAGATFVSATGGGVFAAGKVTWNLGDVPSGGTSTFSVSVHLGALGAYANTAHATYKVGLNEKTVDSNEVVTTYTDVIPEPAVDAAADAPSDVADGPADPVAADAGPTTDAADAPVSDSGGSDGGVADVPAEGSGGADGGAADVAGGGETAGDAAAPDAAAGDAGAVDASSGDGPGDAAADAAADGGKDASSSGDAREAGGQGDAASGDGGSVAKSGGGCGCDATGGGPAGPGALFMLAAVAVLGRRRARRRG